MRSHGIDSLDTRMPAYYTVAPGISGFAIFRFKKRIMLMKYASGRYIVLTAFAAACLLVPFSTATAGDGAEVRNWSVFAYGGKWSNNRIGEILQGTTRLRSSYVWVCGVSRTLHRFSESLVMEVEVNAARHTGRQDHFEFNAATSLRWKSFPWDRYLRSTIAYGVGPSYAVRRPPIEQRSNRGPTHVLVSMPVEITFAPAAKYDLPWEMLFRVHHRSGAYGVVSDARGSNFVTAGLRYRF